MSPVDAIVGLDIGTTRVKAAVFDREGREVAFAARIVETLCNEPGMAEQDAWTVWESASNVIAESVEKAVHSGYRIAAVGVTGQGDGLWPMDEQIRPVGRAILWWDTRANGVLERWARLGLLDRYRQITGHGLFAGMQLPILAWLQCARPAEARRIRWPLFAKDWVRLCLCDFAAEVVTDPGSWERSVGALLRSAAGAELLRYMGLEVSHLRFPAVAEAGTFVGRVGKRAAAMTGLLSGTPVSVGVMDVTSTALGLGATKPRDGIVILGTTAYAGLVYRSTDEEAVGHPSLPHGVPGLRLVGMGTLAGTPNLDWALALLRLEDLHCSPERLDELVASVPPGSDGVIYLPFISPGGERAPFLDPRARAQFCGLTARHGPPQLLRAVMEGVTYSVRHCYEALGKVPDEVYLGGGGSRSSQWTEIVANVLARPVMVSYGSDFATRGAALLAGHAAGVYRRLEMAPPLFSRVAPDSDRVRVYDGWFRLYRKWVEAQQELWQEMACLREQARAVRVGEARVTGTAGEEG